MTKQVEPDAQKQSRIMQARTWLGGYIDARREVPTLAYYDAGSEDDNCGRMALAHLLMNGEAPTEILQMLAHAITPDDDDTPIMGRLVYNEYAPSTIIEPERHPRRLDFSKRGQGKRSRGTRRIPDPVKDGFVLTAIYKHRSDGFSKTRAFEAAAKEVNMSPEGVREVWNRYPDHADWWERDVLSGEGSLLPEQNTETNANPCE